MSATTTYGKYNAPCESQSGTKIVYYSNWCRYATIIILLAWSAVAIVTHVSIK